jgi:precorrin-2/cobalt-factor-2 C20-methyltransferase
VTVFGTLYGIGVGPGDPELITVKGANLLAQCRHIFVPKARITTDSVALSIAGRYINESARVYETVFTMTSDKDELSVRWKESAKGIIDVLRSGEDACFITLGDPFLYSTYIYMLRELRKEWPDVSVVTVPGITSFSAIAALTEFPLGEGREPLTVIPAIDDLDDVRRSLEKGGTIVLMKIGKRLNAVLDILDEAGLIERGVFVTHAGMANQRIETDLRSLKGEQKETGYLSTLIIHTNGGNK